jgi:Bromodomain/Bromodomain extra-terminal - transcription regulation
VDLGTIKKNIENDRYESIEDIANDVRLVWTNCMLYNRDGSEYYHLADTFARGFEEAYAAFRRLEDSKSDTSRIPTVEEKIQLSYDIFKVDNSEIARALTMIQNACPSALSRKVASDEVLINLDALTPLAFHEVNAFVLGCVVNGGAKSKKKRAAAVAAQSIAAAEASHKAKRSK